MKGVLWGILIVLILFSLSIEQSSAKNLRFGEGEKNENQVFEAASVGKKRPEGAQVEEGKIPDYPDPNKVPYRTRKSLLVHFFSVPAKVWHLALTPLGATIIWMEQKRVPQKLMDFFYLNDERTAAIFPLVSLGGNTGAGAGFMAFHNNVFGKRKRLSLSALYNTGDNNNAKVAYQDSSLFGSSFYFDLTGEYFNDSDENLYIDVGQNPANILNSSIGGNNSAENDETSYATEEIAALSNLGYAFNARVGLGVVSSFRSTDIDSGDGTGGERFPGDIPGADLRTKLFTIGGALTLNFTKGYPRVLSGTLVRLRYTYTNDVDGDRFEYNRFTASAEQFIPIPFLARNRRLALRGVFEKMDRIGDKQIPFYELSMLGDASNLRGFDQNRFRGRGLLLFNLEYRYPVWDTWDAVVFVDEGQVYDDLGDLDVSGFHTSIGTGLRFMSRNGFLMRFEVARSSEEWRALFQITPNFPIFSLTRDR